MLPTELPRLVFGFQKYVDGTGRSTVPIQVQISCGRMIKIINMIFFSIKQTWNLFLIDFKQHRNRKCLPFIEISNQMYRNYTVCVHVHNLHPIIWISLVDNAHICLCIS